MIKLKTNLGTIQISLKKDATPKTVENFMQYVKEGFFDNTIFHRVIDSFVIQGGGFTKDMVQKPTKAPVANEADLGISNKAGTIAMARTNDPHSATSQFFINLADNAFLDYKDKTVTDWGYCAFGEVTEGMDVVAKIAKVATSTQNGHQDVPVEPVVLESVSVVEAVAEA